MEQSFIELKQALCCKPILQAPDVNMHFVLQIDASEVEIGVVLSHLHEGV